MRWILGIDTRNRSQGALRFAAWLREQMRDEDYEAHGFHVLEHDEMMVLLRRHHLAEVLEDADKRMREAIEAANAGDVLTRASVAQAQTAEQALADAARLHDADGLIIGRSAMREGRSLVRLGRVARRLVRTLPAPVVVTPPDLDTGQLGDGPVVCAVSPKPESVDAAHKAVAFAELLGREAVLVHCLRLPQPASLHDGLISLDRESAEQRLSTFCETHGLTDVRREVVIGAPEDAMLRRSAELGAPLVVCGSRRLDIVQRVFQSSVGTHLASYSKVPVVLVPPI